MTIRKRTTTAQKFNNPEEAEKFVDSIRHESNIVSIDTSYRRENGPDSNPVWTVTVVRKK